MVSPSECSVSDARYKELVIEIHHDLLYSHKEQRHSLEQLASLNREHAAQR